MDVSTSTSQAISHKPQQGSLKHTENLNLPVWSQGKLDCIASGSGAWDEVSRVRLSPVDQSAMHKHGHSKPEKSNTWRARFVGSALTGLIEISIFHPLDTVSKRLMANHTGSKFSRTVFGEAVTGSVLDKVRCLYPGLGYGVIYKVSQRILR